jgi:hypothetical protein
MVPIIMYIGETENRKMNQLLYGTHHYIHRRN